MQFFKRNLRFFREICDSPRNLRSTAKFAIYREICDLPLVKSVQIWPNVTNVTKSYNCSDECDLILANQLLTHISFCFCNTRLVITYWHGSFLINKRPASISPTRSSLTLRKKPHPCAKQGNESAADQAAEIGRNLFYADDNKLFSVVLAIL